MTVPAHVLLRMTPIDALREILRPNLKEGVDPSWFVVDRFPYDTDQSTLTVEMRLDHTLAPVEYWGSYGMVEITWNRLDISHTLDMLNLVIKAKPPMYVKDVVDIIQRQWGIVFTPEDYANTFVPEGATTVAIKATNQSLRWHGTYNLQLTVE